MISMPYGIIEHGQQWCGNRLLPEGNKPLHEPLLANPQWRLKAIILDMSLTHWYQVRHICVVDLTIIGSDNGLSPGQRQAII